MLDPVGTPDRSGRRGPAPGATRDEVVACARRQFLACRRVDVQVLAATCGVGRATIYRWFGSREQILGEAMLGVVEERLAAARAAVGGTGADALMATIDLVYRGLSAAPHVRWLIDNERATALTVITSSSGQVHPRMTQIITAMIEAEVEHGYVPTADPVTLAYTLVRLAEGLLFNFTEDDIPKDLDRMRAVLAALIGAGRQRSG